MPEHFQTNLAPEPPPDPRRGLTRIFVVFYCLFFAIGLGWMAWRRGWHVAWEAFSGGNVRESLLYGAGIGAGTIVCWAIFRRFVPWLRMLEEDFRSLLGPMSFRATFFIAVLSGVAEETFFRGALQPEAGIVFASLYFAALHVPFRLVYVIWTAFAFGMGMVLGWLFDSTGNLLGPILAHVLINAVNLRRITRPERRPQGR